MWKILGALRKAHIGIEVSVGVEKVWHGGVEKVLRCSTQRVASRCWKKHNSPCCMKSLETLLIYAYILFSLVAYRMFRSVAHVCGTCRNPRSNSQCIQCVYQHVHHIFQPQVANDVNYGWRCPSMSGWQFGIGVAHHKRSAAPVMYPRWCFGKHQPKSRCSGSRNSIWKILESFMVAGLAGFLLDIIEHEVQLGDLILVYPGTTKITQMRPSSACGIKDATNPSRKKFILSWSPNIFFVHSSPRRHAMISVEVTTRQQKTYPRCPRISV